MAWVINRRKNNTRKKISIFAMMNRSTTFEMPSEIIETHGRTFNRKRHPKQNNLRKMCSIGVSGVERVPLLLLLRWPSRETWLYRIVGNSVLSHGYEFAKRNNCGHFNGNHRTHTHTRTIATATNYIKLFNIYCCMESSERLAINPV